MIHTVRLQVRRGKWPMCEAIAETGGEGEGRLKKTLPADSIGGDLMY